MQRTLITRNSRKGQGAFEIILTIMILMFLIITFLYVKIWQSVQESTDLNDIALARESVEKMAETVDLAGLSPIGTVRDITIHLPFNTVDIECGYVDDDTVSGNTENVPDPGEGEPYEITFTVLLYDVSCDPANKYTLPDGTPTQYCYKELTVTTDFPVSDCQLCDTNTQIRGNAWVDDNGDLIGFCCDAGFNMHMWVRKDPMAIGTSQPNQVQILQRRYWELKDENGNPQYWNL